MDGSAPGRGDMIAGPLAGFAGLAARIPLWLIHAPRSDRARAIERAAYRRLARGLGISVQVQGTRAEGAVLHACNHISWADIPVLGGTLDAAFVAKAQVARWPVIGALARRTPTLFIDREHRSGSGAQADALRACLQGGRGVLLFPEGTTSDGSSVLPFRSSLFAAADAAHCVQPVALSYLAADGGALTPERLRQVAWIGDDGLMDALRGVARAPLGVLVQFLTPLPASMPRKALAAACRDAIAQAHAAAPNRWRYRAEIASTGTTRNTSTVLNCQSITAPSPTIAPTRR